LTDKPTSNSQVTNGGNKLISRLMLGLLGWAIFLGIGASMWSYDYRKGAIIVGCMGLFIVVWWLALLSRKWK
jgi:hypothetical protein